MRLFEISWQAGSENEDGTWGTHGAEQTDVVEGVKPWVNSDGCLLILDAAGDNLAVYNANTWSRVMPVRT